MGLFDGAANGKGSCSEIAKSLGFPVILLVDCASMGQSVAALVYGFLNHDPELSIAGRVSIWSKYKIWRLPVQNHKTPPPFRRSAITSPSPKMPHSPLFTPISFKTGRMRVQNCSVKGHLRRMRRIHGPRPFDHRRAGHRPPDVGPSRPRNQLFKTKTALGLSRPDGHDRTFPRQIQGP